MGAYPAAAMKQLALLQLAAANHIQIKHRPGSAVRRPTVEKVSSHSGSIRGKRR